MNRKHIKYHPSYRFTWDELNQMIQGQKNRMTRERAEYRRSQGRESRRNTRESIAEMSRYIASLQRIIQGSIQGTQSNSQGNNQDESAVPGQVTAGTQLQILRVSVGTTGGSIFDGRNEQARQRQQGQGRGHRRG